MTGPISLKLYVQGDECQVYNKYMMLVEWKIVKILKIEKTYAEFWKPKDI